MAANAGILNGLSRMVGRNKVCWRCRSMITG